jgi:hypothetical protein
MSLKKRVIVRYVALFAGVAFCGALLLHTSQTVQRKEAALAALQSDLVRERQSIEVLEAEWAHLNSPYRLEKLAQDYLHMVPPSAQQIMPDPDALPSYQAEAVFDASGTLNTEGQFEEVAAKNMRIIPKRKPSVVKVSAPPERAVDLPHPEPKNPVAPEVAPAPAPQDDMSGLLQRLGGGE